MLVLIKSRRESALFVGINPGPGAEVDKDDAIRMMDLYVKRLELASQGKASGIVMTQEPSHVFFDTKVLIDLANWKFVSIAFALAYQETEDADHRPPTEDEATKWLADQNSVPLVQTVILAESDDTGKILFDPAAEYELYDFAGQCCHLEGTASAKQSCIRSSFVVPGSRRTTAGPQINKGGAK